MGEQSWRQQVDDIDPRRNDDPVVYAFSKAGVKSLSGRGASRGTPSKPTTQGVFTERKLHGAYDGDNT